MCVICQKPTYNEVCDACIRKAELFDELAKLLRRSRRFVEFDVSMMDAVCRHGVLPDDDHVTARNTEFESELLLREIDHVLELI